MYQHSNVEKPQPTRETHMRQNMKLQRNDDVYAINFKKSLRKSTDIISKKTPAF